MIEPISQSEYPWWVKLSMLGVPGRKGLWKFVIMSLTMAIGCMAAMVAYFACGSSDWQFFAIGLLLCSAIIFLLSARMYWLTIRWIDQHGDWDSVAKSDPIAHSAKGLVEDLTSKGFAKWELSGSQQVGRWILVAFTVSWLLHFIASAVLKYQKDIFNVSSLFSLGVAVALLMTLWQGSNFARWAAVGLCLLGLGLTITGTVTSELKWKHWIDVLSLVTGLSLSVPWVGNYLTALRDHQKLNNMINENNSTG